jgi:hypothetical protein
MADESPVAAGAGFSWRVWLVVACAVAVIVFLAIVLPGVFDLTHGKRSYLISDPVERIVIDSKGTTDLDIEPSRDGRVHIERTSSISTDSHLLERHRLTGKTLTLTASCSGSRFGVLKRCDLHYQLRVPRKVALSIHVHLGQTTIRGVQGRLDFTSDAGDFDGSGCSRRAYFSLGFGRLRYRDTCKPTIVHALVRAGDVELTVPAGRYDVYAHTHFGGGVRRPFENIIEAPSSPHKLDVELRWGGSIRISGAQP